VPVIFRLPTLGGRPALLERILYGTQEEGIKGKVDPLSKDVACHKGCPPADLNEHGRSRELRSNDQAEEIRLEGRRFFR